jgi:hypothetical protein
MRKYIPQATYENFVYPNNDIAIYDNNDVVQNINSNEITGTITGFTATVTGTTITVSFNYTWNKNGGEVFINQANRLHLFSVHMMTPAKKYFNPWRLIDYKYVTGTTQNSYTGSFTTSITQANFGEAFTVGVYSFEIRFIGGLNTYVICANASLTPAVSPTPTPTTSPGSPPSTPTPTPSVTASPGSPPSSPTPTPSVTASPGTSQTPTPTPTRTMTPTPSTSAPVVYYGFPINIGYSTSGLACADGTTNITIYGANGGFLSNTTFYTDTTLTSPYFGSSFYYQNTATTQYVQIGNSGENLGGGTC